MSRRRTPTHPAVVLGDTPGAEVAFSADPGRAPGCRCAASSRPSSGRPAPDDAAGVDVTPAGSTLRPILDGRNGVASRRPRSDGGPRRSRPVAGLVGRGDTTSESKPDIADRRVAGGRWALRDRITRGRRRRDLEAAVPEALDVLRATVAAGASPATGLAAIAESATGPLADVLNGAVRACALGVPAGRALADAGAAASVMELVTTGEALDLAATTGAPPGPVLAGVARAATDRARARQARLAATAGARLSVKVLAALGPGFVGLLAMTAPSDVAFLVREPSGWMTLALALAFEVAGLLWARRILEDRR